MTILQAEAVHPLFGARVRGVQLFRPMSDATFAEVRALVDEYSVLVFPDQDLNEEGHVAFTRRFGPLQMSVKGNQTGGTIFAHATNVDMKTGEIVPIDDSRMSYLRVSRLWHTDGSFRPVPSTVSIGAGVLMPPVGGNTEFASCRAAYDTLPAQTKDDLHRLEATHDLMHSLATEDPSLVRPELREDTPPYVQPMLRINPRNKRKALYVGSHACRVTGMSEDEGLRFIGKLNAHATQSRFVYSHVWTTNDVVIWDNSAVMHRATPYELTRHKRIMRRSQGAGVDEDFRRERELLLSTPH